MAEKFIVFDGHEDKKVSQVKLDQTSSTNGLELVRTKT